MDIEKCVEDPGGPLATYILQLKACRALTDEIEAALGPRHASLIGQFRVACVYRRVLRVETANSFVLNRLRPLMGGIVKNNPKLSMVCDDFKLTSHFSETKAVPPPRKGAPKMAVEGARRYLEAHKGADTEFLRSVKEFLKREADRPQD